MKNKTILMLMLIIFNGLQVFSQISTNPDTVCVSSNVYYKIPNPIANSTYTWGVYNSQGSIIYGAGTDSIRIVWDNTTGIDSLWVVEKNIAGCEGDTTRLKVVRIGQPTAEFDNVALCAGETLHVNFVGYAPWQIEYTLNGNTVTQTGITQNPYSVGTQAGNYVLMQISDKYCNNTVPSGTTNAVIAEELQELQIYHE